MTEEQKNGRWLLLHKDPGMATAFEGSFGRLSDAEHLNNVLCAGFRLTDEPDEWSNFVNQVKNSDWSVMDSAVAILSHMVRHRSINKSVGPAVLCPILGSADLMFDLSRSIGPAFGRLMADPPNVRIQDAETPVLDGRAMLYKDATYPPLHKLRTRESRIAAVRGTYRATTFADADLPDTDIVFLIDDIVTLGSSMNDAARAIKEANPCVKRVYGIALAKSERRSYSGVDNSRLPSKIRRIAGIGKTEPTSDE